MAASNSEQLSTVLFLELDASNSRPLPAWQAAAVLDLRSKLEDPDVYKRWLDATLPHLAEYLRGSGWSGKIIIHDEAGAILDELVPRKIDQLEHEMNLVRSPDGKFRLKSSQTFAIGPRVTTLFDALTAQLTSDGVSYSAAGHLYSFDYFLKNDCTGLTEILDGIFAGPQPV